MKGGKRSGQSGWRPFGGTCSGQGGRRNQLECLTFFFRNFPENYSGEQMRGKFEEIGRIHEVFIPQKRDKLGNKFGFVRFLGKVRAKEVLEKLNKVWIGSHIIRAYLPRFDRGEAGEKERRKGEVGRRDTGASLVDPRKFGERASGISYSEILTAQGRIKWQEDRVEKRKGEGGAGLTFQSSEEESKWLKDAFMG